MHSLLLISTNAVFQLIIAFFEAMKDFGIGNLLALSVGHVKLTSFPIWKILSFDIHSSWLSVAGARGFIAAVMGSLQTRDADHTYVD